MSGIQLARLRIVSIIFLFWACAGFLVEPIKSVQLQTYWNWEFLIQDDSLKGNMRKK